MELGAQTSSCPYLLRLTSASRRRPQNSPAASPAPPTAANRRGKSLAPLRLSASAEISIACVAHPHAPALLPRWPSASLIPAKTATATSTCPTGDQALVLPLPLSDHFCLPHARVTGPDYPVATLTEYLDKASPSFLILHVRGIDLVQSAFSPRPLALFRQAAVLSRSPSGVSDLPLLPLHTLTYNPLKVIMANKQAPKPRMSTFFVPGTGIDREVITTDICRYLGNDALVKPGPYQVSHCRNNTSRSKRLTAKQDPRTGEVRHGYFVTAYRALTTVSISSLT